MGQRMPRLKKWLSDQGFSIRGMATDLGIAYRTAWMAANGYKVTYDVAKKIEKYTEGVVTIDELCSAPSRTEL